MIRRPPRSTRTDTLFPYPTLFRSADRRVMTARDQARIASDALRAASVRVQAGRASPLEQQRADVARINAAANVERPLRSAEAARANLRSEERRVGKECGSTGRYRWLPDE